MTFLLHQDDKRLHDYNVDEIVKQAIDDAVRQVSDWRKGLTPRAENVLQLGIRIYMNGDNNSYGAKSDWYILVYDNASL